MKCDFLVIGGGIAGATAGYWLSRFGNVVLVEMEAQAGYHATGRSVSLYCESYGPPQIRKLSRLSKNFLQAPPDDLELEYSLMKERDILYLAPPSQVRELEEAIDKGNKEGGHYEWISHEDALQRVPILRPEYFSAAACEGGAFDIDVNTLHQAYLRCLKRQGGTILLNREVMSIGRENGMWYAATREERLTAPIVINAAGAWAGHVSDMAGALPVTLTPLRRTVIGLSCKHEKFSADWPMVETIRESLYFKPEANGIIVSPGDETLSVACDAQPEEIDVAITIDRLQSMTNLEIMHINSKWAGLRTFANDREPVVGEDPQMDNFFWFAGQGGYGIQTSPALGELLSILVSRKELPYHFTESRISPDALSPGRFIW